MTKTLVFQLDDAIHGNTTFMLAFDKPSADPNIFQAVYRVLDIGSSGMKTAHVRYDLAALSFSVVQVEDGPEVRFSERARVTIAPGQKTSIIPGSDSASDVKFTDPTSNNLRHEIKCTNNAPTPQIIAIGFPDQPLWVWPLVRHGEAVVEYFKPILTVYQTVEYMECQVIRGEIAYPILLRQDLTELPETQTFIIGQDSYGSWTIKPADTS